ncbi:MAG TPA: hypothetical protein PKA63_08140 [Oligoflexia bacterium]|nr:hypothetical protein [Oligoflexia bacterium]HMP48620.1 hypothetical protein [Oligoflexia bacterium]
MNFRKLINALFFILTACLFYSSLVFAEKGQSDELEPVEELIEEGRSEISSRLFMLTDEIDALFNDARSIEQRTDDWIRLGLEVRFRASDNLRFRQRIGAGFNLEQLSSKLRLIFEAENGDAYQGSERLEDTPQAEDFIRQTNRDGGSGALRYFILKNNNYQLTADAGMRFSGGLNPFARLRGNYWFELNELWSMEPSQVLFFERKEGYGGRTRLDFNRFLTEDSFFRIRNEAFLSENSRGMELFEEFSYLSRLSENQTLSIPAAFITYTKPDPRFDVFRVSLRYRGPLIKQWLYIVLEPGMDFPDDRDYKRTPFLSIRLDALFDRRAAFDSSV